MRIYCCHCYRFPANNKMEGVEELSKALLTLAQKILGQEGTDGVGTVRLLLLDVDAGRFKSMFDRWGCKTFASLRHALDHYYLTAFEERIRWDSPAITSYRDEFVEVFLFVLDLALRSGRSAFIEGILALEPDSQEVLQPFVKAVTERESFLERAEGERRDDGVLELLEENERLKRLCDQWLAKYQDLKGEHDDLRAAHERAAEELHLLRQDHQLLNQIGGSGTVEEALEKVRRDFADYERLIERLKKELEEKKGLLGQREEEIRSLEAGFKAQRSMEKMEKLQQAQHRIRTLQEEAKVARGQQQQARVGLEECRQTLQVRETEVESLRRRVGELEAQAEKFMNIRRLHNQYREKILKEYKQTRE